MSISKRLFLYINTDEPFKILVTMQHPREGYSCISLTSLNNYDESRKIYWEIREKLDK